MRRADPRAEPVEDRSVSQGGVETAAQNRDLRSCWTTSLAWCMDPAQHQRGWRGSGGDEAGDSGCYVVWAAAWSRKDKGHLPRQHHQHTGNTDWGLA